MKMKKLEIIADCHTQGQPLSHMWSKCVGAGRAAEALRADWQKQLRQAKEECGFEYIRFHGLLAEDMFVCQKEKNTIFFNWQYIDAVFDFLMEVNVRPVVEFGFMPPLLASGLGTQFWWRGNVTPPEKYSEWGRLIKELVQHWKERYGLNEIRQWYYEVWNEPNLHAFWNGTRSQYFELYKESVLAVKSVDEELRVGGPATSNFVPDDRFESEKELVEKQITHMVEDLDSLQWKGVWIERFLEYCANENLPVDFVSAHPYPTDFALDGQQQMKGRTRYVGSLRDDMEWLLQTIRKSTYPDAQILLTEWSSSPTSRDYSHDYLPEANYIIQANLETAGMAECLSYWVFTDIFEEAGGAPEAFHGGFGMMNVKGIRKPSYYAYLFLHRLGREKLIQGNNYIVTRKDNGKISILLWNDAEELKQVVPISEYPDYSVAEKIQEMGENQVACIKMAGLKSQAEFKVYTLEKKNTVGFMWAQMGHPKNLTREQEDVLNTAGPKCIYKQADKGGILNVEFIMEPWEIILIEEE